MYSVQERGWGFNSPLWILKCYLFYYYYYYYFFFLNHHYYYYYIYKKKKLGGGVDRKHFFFLSEMLVMYDGYPYSPCLENWPNNFWGSWEKVTHPPPPLISFFSPCVASIIGCMQGWMILIPLASQNLLWQIDSPIFRTGFVKLYCKLVTDCSI